MTIEERRAYYRAYYHANKEKSLAWTKAGHANRRLRVLRHYSLKDWPECACCEESALAFLSIDHKNGGGVEHRKQVGSSYRYYSWLIRNDFPDGYQVLCHNCNQATSYGRICPHKELLK